MESSSQSNLPKVPKLARPWDLLNKNIGRVSEEVKKNRLDICSECPFLFKISKQCRKCGCFMPAKTELPHASCPIGKWSEEPEQTKEPN